MRWDDLGDDELVARLEQRGVDPATARTMAVAREEAEVAQVIAEVLDHG